MQRVCDHRAQQPLWSEQLLDCQAGISVHIQVVGQDIHHKEYWDLHIANSYLKSWHAVIATRPATSRIPLLSVQSTASYTLTKFVVSLFFVDNNIQQTWKARCGRTEHFSVIFFFAGERNIILLFLRWSPGVSSWVRTDQSHSGRHWKTRHELRPGLSPHSE